MDGNHKINWHEVVREIGPGLLAYFKVNMPAPVAAELVQEVLLRLFSKTQRGSFDADKGTLRMFAYGIARHVRHEAMRAEGKTFSSESFDEIKFAPPPSDNNDNRQWMRWAITQLKPIEQEVILLLIDKELELESIARLLELPVGTIKSHAHRAKLALKELHAKAQKQEGE